MRYSKRTYISLGIATMMLALVLFIVGVSKTFPFPPTKIFHYVIIIFTLLGINFGISSGKKLAYTMHDRYILLKRNEGQSQITSTVDTLLTTPILFTFLTILLWSLFIITASLLWNVLTDVLFLGQVRWLMILSMVILICGSYLFYKGRNSDITRMLTFAGKRLSQENAVTKKVVNMVKGTGKNTVGEGMKRFMRFRW